MKLLISLKKRVYCQGRAERVCLAAFREALLNAAAPQASPGERKGPGPSVGTAPARTGPGQERGDPLLEHVCKKLGCSERGLSAAHPPKACRMIGEGARPSTRALLGASGRWFPDVPRALQEPEKQAAAPRLLTGPFPHTGSQGCRALVACLSPKQTECILHFHDNLFSALLGKEKAQRDVLLQSARSDTSVSALKPAASIPFAAHVSAASPVFPCSVLTPFKKIIIMEACSSPASFPKQPRR